MSHSLRPTAVVRRGLVVLLAVWVAGCTRWEPSPRSPEELVGDERRTLRVYYDEGNSNVVLQRASVEGDHVVGFTPGTLSTPSRRQAVALSEVHRVEVEKTDTGKTVLLVGGIGLAALTAAVLVSLDNALDDLSFGSN